MDNFYKPGSHYVICADCGKKIHVEKAMRVNDRYNTFNGMIICQSHFEKANPGLWPDYSYEKPLQYNDLLAPQQPAQPIINLLNDRLPSAPKNLYGEIDAYTGFLTLYWDGPDDPGSGSIQGYKITRAEPQLGAYIDINSNTYTAINTYIDDTADLDTNYSYKIAAINEVGVGPYSNIYYYPFKNTTENTLYLAQSTTHAVLKTGDGRYITIRH